MGDAEVVWSKTSILETTDGQIDMWGKKLMLDRNCQNDSEE